MPGQQRREGGYSLIELLVVLSIVGALAIGASVYLTGKKNHAVRAVMDELEAMLAGAQKSTVATGNDVVMGASGDWKAGTLRLDARPLVASANPMSDDIHDPDKRIGPASEVFTSKYASLPQHRAAGIATDASWYPVALGDGDDLKTFELFKDDPYKSAMNNPLFDGTRKRVVINGLTKKYQTGFSVLVVGITSSGRPIKNGPMGMLVVPADGTAAYRFYRAEGEKSWKRQ